MRKVVNVLVLLALILVFPLTTLAQTATYDTVTIYELQYVPDPETSEVSPLFGDTIVVKGQVMHGPRDLYVGNRWSTYIVDPDSFPKPWSGFLIIQNDTFAVNTQFQFVETGDLCYFTGVVDEYAGLSQIYLLTEADELIPVDWLSTGNIFPDPVTLTTADLTGVANAEQWEAMWVYFENVTIVNNALSSNQASVTDASGGLSYLDDYFWWFRSRFNEETYEWPAAGTRVNAKGFIRHYYSDYAVNPRTDADLDILTNPPSISDVQRDPCVPASSNPVTVSAVIVDENGTVDTTKLHYSVDWSAFQQVLMTANADTFTAQISGQADNAYVRYFLTAKDNDCDVSMDPGDTSSFIYSYVIRDGGLSIEDLQYTWGCSGDASPFEGCEVTVSGIVTTDSSHFSNTYYIQEAEAQWSGIWVRDYNHHGFQIGDMVEVTGTVQENYGVTRIANVDSAAGATLISSGNTVEPVVVTTGEIATGGENAEAYESVLVKVQNLTVTSPDLGYGEFGIDDGTGELIVDDLALNFAGSADFSQDDHIDAMVAIHYFSYYNYKLIPRDNDDIIGHTGIEEDNNLIVNTFSLDQNYPNPFNPTTKILYKIEQNGIYNLTIYNILGQKIKVLVNDLHHNGTYNIQWDGCDQTGNRVGSGIYFYSLSGNNVKLTKKMVLIK
jgi:hypothetical protein